ncbi:hypothetical protein MMF93_30575 [Streptomyces tubbatahanensis]|uniref:Uncharacterized protein n=1 Tax=Streptomyces tubbatahanensis TaxID=2923272 RepID=A0ABY3Y0N0_9ACTN|nr:hypothetical protein [Streptomyces tubbatahanensis]UNT00325.1 hypothetical protein MMF93_30575 [Streptomyces tubbatahanensis]
MHTPAPPRPPERPSPAPPDEPAPTSPEPSPSRSLAAAPRHLSPDRQQPDGSMSMVTRTLLVIAPAVLAAAALRPRTNSARQAASGASGDATSGG